MEALWILTFLFVKHFWVDFAIQYPYMLKEKGTYGAWGGIHHAFLHGMTTAWVLIFFVPATSIGIQAVAQMAVLDMFLHYHIDWIKAKVSARFTPQNVEFWWLLGLDQLCHYLTYLIITAIIITI